MILMCLFVLRIVVFSGSYPDAICLLSILSYFTVSQYIKTKTIHNEMADIVQKNKELAERQMQALLIQIQDAKNSSDGIKAAINFTKRV